ncbi:MAG: sulfatase [Verrucomicrobiae bacterium]|nr:sulfatase [Verrucomicrobiae bacterium]NNJ43307.1 sulfatase [Akkermansiaceae bacterium]
MIRALISLLILSSLSLAGKKNILLLCIDDLRPELNCYGVDYIKSPHIDSLAAQGTLFQHHYVQSPTCGSSRYAMLTGRYGPADNGALFQRAEKIREGDKYPASLPAYLKSHGYTTVSVGKVSHHPGGFGGRDWDDSSKLEMPNAWSKSLMPCGPWKHPRGAMHGLANGEVRVKAKDMAVYQATKGPDTTYPDGLITNEAIQQLDQLAAKSKTEEQPFFLAVGIIRPHLPFGAPAKFLDPYKDIDLPAIPHPEKPEGVSTWHASWEFRKYKSWGNDARTDDVFATEVRKHYAACVTYADAQVGRLIEHLKKLKLTDDTIIVLWGDHGWHLGEHNIWGKHALFEESLRSPLIVHVPGNKQQKEVNTIVESIDIYPTLCDFAGLVTPKEVHGISLKPLIYGDAINGGEAVSYFKNVQTIRTPDFRLIRHTNEGATSHIELYHHKEDGSETQNIAGQHPEVVKQLEQKIVTTLDQRKN